MLFTIAVLSAMLSSVAASAVAPDEQGAVAAKHARRQLPHMITFDGVKFDAQPKGELTFLTSDLPKLTSEAADKGLWSEQAELADQAKVLAQAKLLEVSQAKG